MTVLSRRLIAGSLMVFLTLSGCASRKPGDGPPRTGSNVPPHLPSDPIPHKEPRSRYGNGPVYEVNGRHYRVMRSNYGYSRRGVASWYGNKFHGRRTSSGEIYDMHAMTAAHKTLPLPTFVEVRNLRNNKTVIVRINDRGPFVGNRLIDLSYSAARKLDMLTEGTSLVEVTAISFDKPPVTRPPRPQVTKSHASTERAVLSKNVYVQVGAFGDKNNATRRFSLLLDHGIREAFVYEESGRSPALYRIRIGPIVNADQYENVVARLESIGITETHLVTD